MKKKVIVITGNPASGKTTIGKYIASQLQIPILHRDELKEVMADSFEGDPSENVAYLGTASYRMLYYVLEQMLRAGKDVIIESNFNYEVSTPILTELLQKYGYDSIVIRLRTSMDVLYDRFITRDKTEQRHSIHKRKNITYDMFTFHVSQIKSDEITLDGFYFDVDTSDFSKINYDDIIEKIGEYRK